MTVDDDVDYYFLLNSGVSPPGASADDSSSTILNEDVVRSSSSYIPLNGLSVYSSPPPPSPHEHDEEESSTVTGLNVYALHPQEEEQVKVVSSEAAESQHDAANVHVKNTTTNSGNDDNSPPIHHIHSPHHIINDPSRLRDSDNDMDGIRNFGMVDLDAEEVHIKFPIEKNGINQDNPIRYIPNDTGVEGGGGGGGEGDEEEIEAVAKAPNEEGKVICQNVDGDYGSFMTDGGVMVRYQYEVNIDSGVDINDVIPVIERRITDALLPVFFEDECLDEYSESSSLRAGVGGGGLRGGERRLQFKLSGIDMSPLDLPIDTGCGYPEPDPMSKCYVIEGGVTLHFPPNYSSEMFVQGAQLSTLNALRESMSYGHLNNAHSSIKKLKLSDSSYSEEPDVLTRDDLEKKDDGNGGRGIQILGILVGVGLMICCCFCGCGFLIWWRQKIAAADEDDSLGKTKLKKTKKKKMKTRSYSSDDEDADDEDEQSSMHRKKKKKRKHKKKKNLLPDDDDEVDEEDGSNRRKLKNKDTFPHTRKMRDSSARSDPYSEQLIRDLKASEEMNAAVGDEGSDSSSVRRHKKKKKKMKRKKAKKKRSREILDSDNTDTDNTNTDTDGENTKETTTSSDSTTDNSSTTGSKEDMSTTSSSGDDDDNNSTTTSGDDDDNDSTTTSTSEDEDEFDHSGGVMSQSNFVSQRRGIRQQQRRVGPPPTRFNFMKGRSERNYRLVFGSGDTDGDDNESVMTGGTGMQSQASAATAQVKNMPSSGGSFFNDDTSVMTGISAKTQMMSNTGRAATPLASYFGNGSGSDSEPSNTGRSRVSNPSRQSSKHGSGSDSEPSNAGRSYGGTSRNSDPSRRSSDSEPSNAMRNRFHTSLTSRQSTGSGSDSEPSNTSSIPANLRTSHGSDRRSFASKDSGPSRTSSR